MADGSIIIGSSIDSSQFIDGLKEMRRAGIQFTADLARDFKVVSGAYGELSKTLSATSQHIKSVKVDGSLRDVVNSVKTSMDEISRTLQKGNVVRVDDRPFSSSMEKMREESRKFRQQVKEDFDEVGISGKELAGIIKKGIAAFAGYKAVKMGQGMLMDAARYETLGIVMEQSGKNAGYSAEQMHKFQEELQETGISAIETRQALASISTSGIDLEAAPKLARAAQDLAVVAGTDSSEAFQRLIDGVQTGNTLMLKTLGLNMNFEQSYQSLAHTIGKTSSQLTEQDKIQIRQIAVLQEATKSQGIYAASMMTAGKQLGSLTRHISDLGKNIGTLGLDALAYGVQDVTTKIEGANAQFKAWAEDGSLDKMRRNVGEGFKLVAQHIDTAAVALLAYTVARKVATSETLKAGVAEAGLLIQHGRGKAVILESLKAKVMQAQASHAAAVADLEAAKAVERKALADVKAAKATLGRSVTFRQEKQALEGLSTAYYALKKSQETVVVANAKVAVTTAAVDAAQKKATVSAHALATAQIAWDKAKRGFTSLVNFMGGPLVFGITAAVAVFSSLSSYMRRGEEESQRLRDALRDVGNEADATGQKVSQAQTSLALVALQAAKEKVETEQAALDKAIEKVKKASRDSLHNIVSGFSRPFVDELATKYLADYGEGLITIEEAWKGVLALEKEHGKTNGIATARKLLETVMGGTIIVEKATAEQKKAQEQVDNLSEAQKRATITTNAFGASLVKIREEGTPKTYEEAIKYLQNFTRETKAAKKEAEINRKRQAEEALAILKKAEAAENAAGSLEGMAGMDYKAAEAAAIAKGDFKAAAEYSELAAKSFEKAAQHYANAREVASQIADYEKKIPEVKFKTSSSGKNTLETIKEIQREIDQLNQKGVETFALKLEKGLESIGKKAKQAGVAKRLKEEYTKALATSEINEFNKKMRELEGNKTDAVMCQLTVDTNNLSAAMQKAGYSTEEVTAATERLKHLTLTSHRKDVLQEEIAFLKDMETLSNQYGLSTEKQNELLRVQAALYRTRLSPELQKLVDEWERLKRLEHDPSWGAGITRAAQKWAAEWTNAGKVAEKQFAVLTSAIDSLGNSIVDSIFDGAEFRADKLFRDMGKQMMRIAMNQMIGGLFASLFGGPTKSLYAPGSVGNGGGLPPFDPGPWKLTAHRGGIAGSASISPRSASSVAPTMLSTFAARTQPEDKASFFSVYTENLGRTALSRLDGYSLPRLSSRTPVEAVRPQVHLNIINQMGDSAQVRTKETPTANGGLNIDALIEQKVRSGISSGRYNQAMRSQFGISPMIQGR